MNNDADVAESIPLPRFKDDKLRILLLHSDAPGAKTPEGFVIGETEHIHYKLFKGWDLALFGHIHKAQMLYKDDKKAAFMLGCPIHQNAGDAGNACGYWELDSKGAMGFRRLSFPQFIKLKPGETPYDNYNYFIKPEEVVEESEVKLGEFNLNKSKKKLAKQFCTAKSIKNKAKLRALVEILNQATNE
jgi:DNA repair exonuclease SbcCD nuclease subunit